MKGKVLKTCDMCTWPSVFSSDNYKSQEICTTSWGTDDSFRLEVRNYNPRRKEAMNAAVSPDTEPVRVQKVPSKLAIDGHSYEIAPNPGDVLIVAKWSWSKDTAQETLRIRILSFRRIRKDRGEAVFRISDMYDYQGIQDFAMTAASEWLNSLPKDLRKDVKRTVRNLLHSSAVRESRTMRRAYVEHVFG